jgi:hypothetical protein
MYEHVFSKFPFRRHTTFYDYDIIGINIHMCSSGSSNSGFRARQFPVFRASATTLTLQNIPGIPSVGNTLSSVVYAQHRIDCIDDNDDAWNQR